MKIAYYIVRGVGFDYSGIYKVEVLDTRLVTAPAPRLKRGVMSRVRKIGLVWWVNDHSKPKPWKKEPETFTIRDSELAYSLPELQDKFAQMRAWHIKDTAQSLTLMAANHSHHLQKLAIYSRGMSYAGAQLEKLTNTKLDCSDFEWSKGE